MDPPQWVWDAPRKKYFYIEPHTNCYVFEDGEKIPPPGQAQVTSQSPPSATPATSQGRLSGGSSNWSVESGLSNLSLQEDTGEGSQTPHAAGPAQASTAADPVTYQSVGSNQYPNVANIQPSSFPQGTHSTYHQQGAPYSGYQRSWESQQPSQYPPYDPYQATWSSYPSGYSDQSQYVADVSGRGHSTSRTTHPYPSQYTQHVGESPAINSPYAPTEFQTSQQPSDEQKLARVPRQLEDSPHVSDLIQDGIQPHKKLRGSPGEREVLDANFYVRRPGYQFFKVGVVFRVLWPELEGDRRDNNTIVTTPRFKGQNIFCKIRWFVVVREGHDSCTCLPIQTYGGRGVTGTKVKAHHAIIYTGPFPPPTLPDELPNSPDELPMGEPIRVIATKPWASKLDSRSRVNFVKVYTIEHNVKVEDFGYVDPDDEWKFTSQFNSRWGVQGSAPLYSTARHSFHSSSAQSDVAPLHSSQSTGDSEHPSVPGAFHEGSPVASPYSMAPIQDGQDTTTDHQDSTYQQAQGGHEQVAHQYVPDPWPPQQQSTSGRRRRHSSNHDKRNH